MQAGGDCFSNMVIISKGLVNVDTKIFSNSDGYDGIMVWWVFVFLQGCRSCVIFCVACWQIEKSVTHVVTSSPILAGRFRVTKNFYLEFALFSTFGSTWPNRCLVNSNLHFSFLQKKGRSFMYTEKRWVPKIESPGTPLSRIAWLESTPVTEQTCLRSNVGPGPVYFNLVTFEWCSSEIKASLVG